MAGTELPGATGEDNQKKGAVAESFQNYPPPLSLKSKKVLITTESLGPINGVTRATEQLIAYLLAHQIETAVLAPHFAQPHQSPALPIVRLKGLPLLYNPDLLVTYPFRLSKVYRRTFRPDIIYLASPASLGLQVWWQARQSGIPLIANFQTDLAFYARLMLPGLLKLNNFGGWSLDRVTRFFLRDAAVKAVLYPSSSSRDYLLKLGVPEQKLRGVGRGVDCELFDPRKRQAQLRQQLAPNGEVLLLCVSRLSLEKGFEFLAEAYARLCERATQPLNFRLIITGGNANAAIAQTVRGYFEKRGLEVHFTGPLTGEALAAMFASADIFVFPSLTETFGQVIQEAMASGLPVVARREGGPADLVLPAETGYLADPPDLAAFCEYTLKLIENAALRSQMGETARKLAENRSWPAINQQISSILTEFAL